MAIEPEDKPRDEEAAPSQDRAVKLALGGIALFFTGPLLGLLSSSLDLGGIMLVLMLWPFLMAAGVGMTIYWSIQAWHRRSPRRRPAPGQSVSILTADVAVADVSYSEPEPPAEKKSGLSFLLVVVITLCSTHMGCIGAIHTAKPSEGDILGLGILIQVASGSALAALIAGLAASLLRSHGSVATLRIVAAVLFVSSIGVQKWHSGEPKRAQDRAEIRRARSLSSQMPPARDFRLHIQIFKWTEYEPEVPEIDIDGKDWSLRYRSVHLPALGLPDKLCTTVLTPPQAPELDVLIGAINERVEAGNPLCEGEPTGRVRFNIGYTSPGGDWSWDVHDECLTRRSRRDAEAQQLYNLIKQIAPVSWQKEKTICTPL